MTLSGTGRFARLFLGSGRPPGAQTPTVSRSYDIGETSSP